MLANGFNSSSSSEDDEYYAVRRRRKIFRPRINNNFISFYEYNERFRMSSIALESLLGDIGAHLQYGTGKSGALSPKQQLCAALHFLGTGAQFHCVGDMHGISKSSVCRSLHRVVAAINRIKFPQIVNWPQGNLIRQEFHELANFPHVCGVIDGSLIRIDAPNNNENDFVDRNGNHSINCMFACGPDMTFYYVSVNWPGSVHDARVLRNSSLCNRFEDGWRPFPNAILLGDSAYPLKEWLIPPVFLRGAENEPQQRFLRAHKSTRRIIENAIGILKEKFPCLNYLRVNPTFAANIVKCCTILCNISRTDEQVNIEIQNYEEHNDDMGDPEEFNEGRAAGANRLRELLLHFT